MGMVPAWRVEIYWKSSLATQVGWFREKDDEDERIFRTKAAATSYANRVTGIPSFLVFFMSRKGVVVDTTRPMDWRDRLRTFLNQKPYWA